MKLSKIAFAVASTLVIATGVAHAGQISSSSATLAIEAIKNNAQVVRAPSKAYTFAGSIDARTNEQRMQLQYSLSKGSWAVGTGQLITAADTLIPVSIAAGAETLSIAYTNAVGVGKSAWPAGSTVSAFVTNSGKTLVFNVTIPAAAGDDNFLGSPTLGLNNNAIGSGNTGLSGLFDVSGAAACVAPDTSMDINFKHFTNHSGNITLQTVAAPDAEHLRSGSINDGRLLNFTQNIQFKFAAASSASRTDAQYLNQRLNGTNWAAPIVAPVAAVAAPVTRHYIGKVNALLRSNGLDLNYANTYGNADNTAGFLAADFTAPATAAAAIGAIETKNFELKLTVGTAWPTGTVLRLVDAAGAAIGAVANVTTTAGQTEFKFTSAVPADIATIATGAYVFADFPGTALIPQTNSIAAVATLAKAPAAAAGTDFSEQDNMCTGTLTGIGGGIKIDVRNYASFATFGKTGPATTVRLINNSESAAADVFGQMIYADGTYGPYGKLADLKPREVVNLSNEAIEKLLTTAASSTNPFGTGTSYTVTGGAAAIAGPKAGTSDRLRIVSNTGTTLRVQSYMVIGNTVIDTSNAQGVDFENSGDRVPTAGVDGQVISQDAINGLAK
jgi:hypothetical protein